MFPNSALHRSHNAFVLFKICVLTKLSCMNSHTEQDNIHLIIALAFNNSLLLA